MDLSGEEPIFISYIVLEYGIILKKRDWHNMLWICYVVLLLLDLDFQTWTFETQSFRPCIPMSNLINRCFRALSPHAPLLWDCRCGSRTSCVAPIVCFVCERLSFGAKWWAESFSSWRWFGGFGEGLFATCCFLKFFKEEKSPTHCFLGQKHMCSKTITFWDVYGEIFGKLQQF